MRKLQEEDLMAIPGDARAELIDGVIYMMAPASARHSLIASLLTAKIVTHTEQKREKGPKDSDSWIILAEAWTDYDKHNSFVHDIAAFSRKDLPELPESGAIQARPVWVCEVISPSNWANDTQRKRVVLEKYGVKFYWLVDPIRKNIQVFELKNNSENYQIIYSAEAAEGILNLPPFKDLDLDLMKIFS
ncbi:MAG: Uma2 family endonuclease [Myxococcaceae bacterium]